MRTAAIVGILLCSCVPKYPAVTLTRYETFGQGSVRVRHCTAFFGWWTQDLLDECGEPLTFVAGTGQDEVCAIYPDDGRSLYGILTSAPYAAVCLEPSTRAGPTEMHGKVKVNGVPRDIRRHRVETVIGLERPPPAAEKPAAPAVTPPAAP